RSCSRSSPPRTSRRPKPTSRGGAQPEAILHYIRLGAGAPPLFFVHGFACSHQDWRLQFTHFSPRHEVIACDLRGHGATPGRPQECSIEHYGGDVAALLTNIDFDRAILVGHSMGCRVVLE